MEGTTNDHELGDTEAGAGDKLTLGEEIRYVLFYKIVLLH